MELEIFQIDAFTSDVLKGNPAAVCFLENWLEDQVMQKIANENNLSETVYYIKTADGFEIRWFTPTIEVPLCGHATLATAYVEFFIKNNLANELVFHSKSGKLTVKRDGDLMTLNFPVSTVEPIEITDVLKAPFYTAPREVYKSNSFLMFVFDSQETIEKLQPNLALVAEYNCAGIITTAKGRDCDFVSRFFGPQSGIDEDPVTGSAHTMLTPYWNKKLGKEKLVAQQISKRHGDLICEQVGDRVNISGQAALYLKGTIFI